MAEICKDRLIRLFCSLVAIDAESFAERQMADRLKREIRLAAEDARIEEDDSAAVTKSSAGNVFAGIPGRGERSGEAPLLFMAHMDTVSPGKGKRAVRREDGRITSDGTTVLGADDLTAVSAILEALRVLHESGLPHRPLELLFTTAEEAYTVGASAFDFGKVRSKEAVAFDCSDRMGSYSRNEPTLLRFSVTVTGKAAHAGFEPEKGINALQAAARAVSKLPLGWADDHTTINIGLMSGGTATNIVPEKAVLSGEIRSAVHQDALSWYERLLALFRQEAEKAGARAEGEEHVYLQAYQIAENDPALLRYQKVLDQLGIPKSAKKNFGGSDINAARRNGIDGICIANPMYAAHTVREYTVESELADLARIVLGLMES